LTFTEIETKKKKYIPGVGKYDLSTADRINTLGVRRSFYK
jgi:hypothetical protein